MLKNKGFTLIEVLISMVILALGIMTIAIILASSLKIIQESQEATESSIFISSLSSVLNNYDPYDFPIGELNRLTFNDKPVIITFSKSTPEQELIKINIILEMRSGRQRLYSIYIVDK